MRAISHISCSNEFFFVYFAAGNVYRTTFNFFNQGEGEQLGSVTTEGPDNELISFLSSQLNDQSHPDEMSPDSSSQQPRDRSSSSRRDDDGNVEFDCD